MTVRRLLPGVTAALLLALSAAGLAACANRMPDTLQLPSIPDETARQTSRFTSIEPHAIQRVKVPSETFRPMRLDRLDPKRYEADPVDLAFPEGATVKDLALSLQMYGLKLAYAEEAGKDGSTVDIGAKKLPFRSFQGKVPELFEMMEIASGIVAREYQDVIYMGDAARYTVSLPQNEEVMRAIAGEIGQLGARDVVTSVHGGQVIYTASPQLNEQRIRPFLQRAAKNLAVITMQVAIVSLAINDNSSQGFNWDAFRVKLDSRDAASGPETPGVPALGDIGNGVTPEPDEDRLGTLVDLTSQGLMLSQTSAGELFGRAAMMTFGGALDFLSSFGETRVTQNVELRTVSGQEVKLRSGQKVPYVKGVSTTVNDSGTSLGGTQTETVDTGLTLTLKPFFDATTALVTVDLDLELNQILDFIELSAGDQVGTLTQPLTQDQNLTDLIRIRAGETIVVGGLQNENESLTGNEPTFFRNRKRSFGSRSQNVSRNALFIIVRPTITMYEPEH